MGHRGSGLSFDGSTGHLTVQNAPSLNLGMRSFTVACWVNMRSVPNDWTAIVTKGDDAWRLSTANKERRFHFAVSSFASANDHVNAMKEVGANEWHHVAAVYTGDVMRLYLDGALDATQPHSGAVGQDSFDVLIGENAQEKGRAFDGLIDDVRIYNCALPESGIKALAAGE